MENFIIKIFVVFDIRVCMILDVLMIFPIWYLKPKFTHIFYEFQTLDLFKKLQEPNPPSPNPVMSKQIGLWKNE
jgi:hypothetical protein